MGSAKDRAPSFFTFLDDSSASKEDDSWLPIPPLFTQLYANRFTVKSKIKGPDDSSWKVNVSGQTITSIGLRKGWKSFVTAYALQPGDLLVVRLVENSVFKAEIYGSKTFIEKLPQSAAAAADPNDQAQASIAPTPPKRGRGRPPLLPHQKKNNKRKRSDSPKASSPQQRPNFVSQRRPVTLAERDKALKLAEEFQSRNPFVVVVLKESHVHRCFWMGLKRGFAREFLPEETTEMVLQDSDGNEWPAKWLVREANCAISGGWRKFALDHELEEGDVGVFELVDQNPRKPVFRVHLYRVVDLKNSSGFLDQLVVVVVV